MVLFWLKTKSTVFGLMIGIFHIGLKWFFTFFLMEIFFSDFLLIGKVTSKWGFYQFKFLYAFLSNSRVGFHSILEAKKWYFLEVIFLSSVVFINYWLCLFRFVSLFFLSSYSIHSKLSFFLYLWTFSSEFWVERVVSK